MPKETARWLWILFITIAFGIIFCLGFLIIRENSYHFLAYSFTKGSLSLVVKPNYLSDLTYFNGKYFWTTGPFPAFLLVPFALIFKLNFYESFLKAPLSLFNFWLILQIAKSLKLSSTKSHALALFYILGSVYTPIMIIPFSVYLSALVTTTLLLATIFEFLNKKRWLLIGLLVSFATLTRFTPILSVFFFLPYLIKEKSLKLFVYFFIPILVGLLFLGIYNYSRFGNVLETGHRYQQIEQEATRRRSVGVFSIQHIPANLYYMLLKSPDPVKNEAMEVFKFPFVKFNPYGMSIFILSPILFLIFKTNFKDRYVLPGLITVLAMLIPIMTYYGLGYRQIGYWHALDFLPFIIFPLVSALKKTGLTKVYILTALGIFITWFFIFQFFTLNPNS